MKVEVRKIGYDAKRIVKNGTGLGSYGRTLINALVQADQAMELRLYAPDRGREELRNQVNESQWTRFVIRKECIQVCKKSCGAIVGS